MSSLPSTMKAIQCHEFIQDNNSNLDTAMTMTSKAELPVLKKNQLLVKIHACSISPGDDIMVRGNLIFLHPSSFPFVPGMDVCGQVVHSNGSKTFNNGDMIVASNDVQPVGGMAEYMAVNEAEIVLKPSSIGTNEAAASSSAITAWNAVMDHVEEGDRVLILGGAGGVGSIALQLAKTQAGASFVATTSTQTDLCKSLGADYVVDYRQENWWEKDQWQEQQFDVIIDTVGGGNFYGKATKVLKTGAKGGIFVAVTGDDPKPKVTTVWKAIKFVASLPLRPMYTRIRRRSLPKYVALMPYNVSQGRKTVVKLLEEKKLQIVLDPKSPLPFTDEGVRDAFRTIDGRHAHGKVVVSMN